jgi:hypothetical protein
MIKSGSIKVYAEDRFLGRIEHSQGDLTYVDTKKQRAIFTGQEWFRRASETVYELVYHGRAIKE